MARNEGVDRNLGAGPRFSPWSRVAVLLLLLMLPIAVAHDFGLGGVEALAVAAGEAGAEDGDWAASLLQRIALNPFKMALLAGAVAALLFGVLQLAAAVIERRLDALPGMASRALLLVSGRGGFSPLLGYLEASLRFGSDVLLGPLRLGVTVFPMLGFIGTVVGLSTAIQNLPAAVADKSKLQPVLDDLYVAFDTTFLGLVGALVCVIMVRLVEAELDRHRHQRSAEVA